MVGFQGQPPTRKTAGVGRAEFSGALELCFAKAAPTQRRSCWLVKGTVAGSKSRDTSKEELALLTSAQKGGPACADLGGRSKGVRTWSVSPENDMPKPKECPEGTKTKKLLAKRR